MMVPVGYASPSRITRSLGFPRIPLVSDRALLLDQLETPPRNRRKYYGPCP